MSKNFALIIVIAIAMLGAWMLRWDVTAVPSDRGRAYVLDRWTGDLFFADLAGIYKMEAVKVR